MNIIKTSEKLLVWMHRTGTTQQEVATALNTNRQSVAKKIKDNIFEAGDIINLKRIGFIE